MLLIVLCVVASVPLLIQAAWTSAMLRDRATAETVAATSAVAERIAARLERFGVHAGGVLHAADARLRLTAGADAVDGSDFLNPLLASAGIEYVALLRPDGMTGNCLVPPGHTCPTALRWLQDRPELVQRAFQPGSAMFATVARDEAGTAGILLVRPPRRAAAVPDATIAWLGGSQIAMIAEAGGRSQPELIAIHDREGQLLYHEDPALRLARLPASMTEAATGSAAATGQPDRQADTVSYVDPADNRRYPASRATVPGLDWVVTAYRRDQGLTALVEDVWTLALGLLAVVLACVALLAWLVRRSLAGSVRQLVGALSAVRQSATTVAPGTSADDPVAGADPTLPRLVRHPVREIRQVAGAVVAMATAVQHRQERDVQTTQAAKLSNDKRSAFVANISHQLRTPLNSIIGFSEMMTDQLFGPLGHAKYLEYALSVHNSGEYLMRILNDLRDLSRAEIGVLDLDETTLDVGRLLRTSVSIVSREAKVHNVSLALLPSDEMPVIRGDEQRLQQALINLINHSVQSSPADGRVEITAVMAQSGELQVRIHDDGPPIPDRDLAKLLTPFDEVQRSYDRRFEGSGLGLPLARTMLDLHGGRLDIQSAVDSGNTLTAILPGSRVLRQTAA